MIMHIKSILAGVALALAATLGSASAADPFTTLDGIPAATMSAAEMAAVSGLALHDLHIHAPGATGSAVALVLTDHLDGDQFLFNDGLREATIASGTVVHNLNHD